MNDFDDLDDLERELGPSLRVALRRAAARITDEPPLEARSLNRLASEAPEVPIDDGAPLLRATEETSTRGVVDVPRTRRDELGRRWRLAAAAVVAALLLFAGAVLVTGSGDNKIRTRVPAGPGTGTTSVPMAPPVVVTPPATVPGDGSADGPLVPRGVPSTTTASDLVAAITLFHKGAYRLYADGRLLWYDETRRGGAFTWAEQRLTPEGVERVRSEFLASGVFDPAHPSSDVPTCTGFFQVCVRDGDNWLAEETDPEPRGGLPFGDPRPEAVRLFQYLGTLDSTLPATEWADQQVKTYVPARIAACLSMYVNRAQAPVDLSVLLPRFPKRAAALLAGREPSAELMRALAPFRSPEMFAKNSCFDVSLEEARTLAGAFLSPSGGGAHQYWGIVIRYGRQPDPAQRGATRREAAYVFFEDVLPEGAPSRYFGG